MADFKFKFETVLRHRELIEDECQRDLAKHLRTRMIFEDEIRKMQGTISESKRELGSALVGKVDIDRIAGFARYAGQSTHRAQQLVMKVADVEKQIAAARAKLLDATRQRKALELLREKQQRQWKQEQSRREAIELDDLATQQYARRLALENAR